METKPGAFVLAAGFEMPRGIVYNALEGAAWDLMPWCGREHERSICPAALRPAPDGAELFRKEMDMKKILIAAVLCVSLVAAMLPAASAAGSNSNYTACMTAIREQKAVQAQAHLTAETLRQKGYSNNSVYIQAAKSTWNEAQQAIEAYQKLSKYTDEDIRILATTVYYEAGSTTEQLREYVAQVVLNRVADKRFPNTIYGVVTQRGQYAGSYATAEATQRIKDQDARNGTYNYLTCVTSAKKAMMGQVDMPANVIFQANFKQGTGVWKTIYFNNGYFSSTSYYCYG